MASKQSDTRELPEDSLYAKGKFLYLGEDKFLIKGVTYGTFRPDKEGHQFPDKKTVSRDFEMMAAHGVNCVRTYTVPPLYVLDQAGAAGLKVMVGLPWEQHLTFWEHRDRIIADLRGLVRGCRAHPAILCYAIGNEIPATIVRWYGKNRIEGFLKRLYRAVKSEDPRRLVTYVNYPTTEYLELPFVDFYCFNVYLESQETLSLYLNRLHTLSSERPLVLAEIGLDSLRNSPERQSEVLKWQIETIYGRGAAGLFLFSWTDEWWRGGFEIEDWDFGLVDRNRQAKPALKTVTEAMFHVPLSRSFDVPFISVIVCSYNGFTTIRETLQALVALDYPQFEVIVVNDGSGTGFDDLVRQYPVTLISTPNRGLSSARNTGLYAAQGEIVTYIDDDAYPDVHWLHYLAYAYRNSSCQGIGGPNIPPEGDGLIAACVALAPGGPVHVLQTDEIAEHIPGCNMSFRREALLAIGGFDTRFRVAGDDVDVCWRIQHAGGTIGFHPGAVVWHHRRNSVKAYWRQQIGYGKAEALLEGKWPEKYNGFGHIAWAGRIYSKGTTNPLPRNRAKVFHGVWGSALFQSLYRPAETVVSYLPLMPEWYLITAFFGLSSLIGLFWPPLLWALPSFVASVMIILLQAALSIRLPHNFRRTASGYRALSLIFLLHLIQPLARLYGRLSNGLTPWRSRKTSSSTRRAFSLGRRKLACWSETWRSPEHWLSDIEKGITDQGMPVVRGSDFNRWDLQVGNALFGSVRILMAIEEHGAGKQFLKFRAWPSPSWITMIIAVLLFCLTVVAAYDGAWPVSLFFGTLFVLLTGRIAAEYAASFMAAEQAVAGLYGRYTSNPQRFEREEVFDPVVSEDTALPRSVSQMLQPAANIEDVD